MSLFSVIVPVYNAEKTLRKCLDSVLSQTYPHFEVLMIENGSGDSSNAICREYAAKDSRFRLYACKENKGPSGARNVGLEQAAGEYIAFIDSDDFVVPEYLDSLHRGFLEADVVFFGYRQLSTEGTFLGEHIPIISEKTDYHETLLQLHKQGLFGYTWVKAFRRNIIGAHRFSMALNLLEDEVFACAVLSEQRRIAVIPEPLYNYITGNTGSLIGRTHPDYCRKVDAAFTAWKQLLRNYSKQDAALTEMANAHVNRCMYYGFERDVDAAVFYGFLAESGFFNDSSLENRFCKHVKARKYTQLSRMRNVYRMKVKIARLLKR